MNTRFIMIKDQMAKSDILSVFFQYRRVSFIHQTQRAGLICDLSDFSTLQLAQPIRLLLEYTGTEYENKFYVCGEGNFFYPVVVILNTKEAPVTIQHWTHYHLTNNILILAPDYDKSCWFDEKPKLGIDFANVSELNLFKRVYLMNINLRIELKASVKMSDCDFTIASLLGGWRQEDRAEQCYHEIHSSQTQHV